MRDMLDDARLLIIDDDALTRLLAAEALRESGFTVFEADCGEEGLRMYCNVEPDLVLLDVMMPGRDGFAVLAHLRAQDREQAVILLTAKSADEDVIQGLALGADDYVSKPFSIAQLVLRVQAVLRRTLGAPSDDAELKLAEDVRIDCANLCGVCRGEEMPFTRREIEVLRYLAAHSERPVPREELLHKVWGYARDLGIETRTVDIHIAKLRRKIEADPKQPQFILTVRGGGYRLQRGAA